MKKCFTETQEKVLKEQIIEITENTTDTGIKVSFEDRQAHALSIIAELLLALCQREDF